MRHLFLLVPWVALGVAAFRPIRDNSFLWHIQAGIVQGQQGRVLTEDPFSLTLMGTPWRTQSWVVELGYGWVFDRVQFWFVSFWIVALGGVMLASIGIRSFRRSRGVLATAGVLIGISWMGLAFLAPRPVIVSFAALSLLILVSEQRSSEWAIPLIIWVWSASHGSFILGIGYLVLHALRTKRGRFAQHAIVGLAVSTCTAHGYHIWGILWAFVRNRDGLAVIQEWGLPQITHPVMWPYAALIALIMVQLAFQRIAPEDLWVIIPFLLFGLTSQRALFLASIVLAPWVAGPRQRNPQKFESTMSSPLIVAVAAILLALPMILMPPTGKLDETFFPIEAAKHLTEEPLFHDAATGGYLILAGDGRRVLVDDRAELYGGEYFEQYIEARSGHPEWRQLFESEGVSQALLRIDDGLAPVLLDEGWSTEFSDDWFLVLGAP